MKAHAKKLFLGLALLSSASFLTIDAFATEGYFQHGNGARNKATGGAGVADGRDGTTLFLNPAALAGMESEASFAVSLFSPRRKLLGTGGPGFTTNDRVVSKENLFAIPSFAIVGQIDDSTSWAIGLNANGGMNTTFQDVTNPACAQPGLPANNGVFCGGNAGVNLSQALISVGFAKQMGNLKIGIAPVFAFQLFEAQGLAAFGGVTSNPGALTDNGNSTSTGFGGRIGIEYALAENIRFGASYQTKLNMSKFDEYAGLFENGGEFDIPSNYQIGIAADVTPDLTFMFDYRRINYSDVPSINNSSRIQAPFGSAGAAGFGWRDIDIFKAGAEWRANDQWTLRAGIAFNEQPISGDDVTLNILAPGVVTRHYTIGGAYAFNEKHTFEFGLMHAPSDSVTGIEITPQGPNPGHQIEIKMHQFEATFGWKMKFGH